MADATNVESTAWMETLSSHRFNPLDEEPQYDTWDFIWGVARDCRFSGQIRPDVEMYSVAEHLTLMTLWARDNLRYMASIGMPTDSPELVQKGLRTIAMHDAQEGLIGDMTRPMKKAVPQFGEVEARVEARMAARYDLYNPLPSWVKVLDNRILVDERAQAMLPTPHVWATDGLEPLGVTLRFWLPRQAANMYSQLLFERLGVK